MNNSNSEYRYLDYLIQYPAPIIDKLVIDNLIEDDEYEKYNEVIFWFGVRITSCIELTKKNKYSYSMYAIPPEGYFYCRIYTFSPDLQSLLTQIKTDFNTISIKGRDREDSIFVQAENIDQFMSKYKDTRDLYNEIISSEMNIPWSNELIYKYREYWNWDRLHKNPSVNWNFELIEKCKEYVNWAFVSSYTFLNWNKEKLLKYKDYLIFSVHSGSLIPLGRQGKNRKGKRYAINNSSDLHYNRGHCYKNLSGSISFSESIKWNEGIISALGDYWDWRELCANEFVLWDERLISKFRDRVSFKDLSKNRKVKWNKDLVKKYIDKWDWQELSGNPSLPWSYEFIETFEEYWKWNIYLPDMYSRDYILKPSISSNSGITWNESMLIKWRERLDFYRIARFGKFTANAVKVSYKEFERFECIGWNYYKWSDCRETEYINLSGWQQLALNVNFYIESENIDYYTNNKIEISYAKGNLAHNGEIISEEIVLMEILKNKPLRDISIEDIMGNLYNCQRYFLNEDFINEDLWATQLKHFFQLKEFRLAFFDSITPKLQIPTPPPTI